MAIIYISSIPVMKLAVRNTMEKFPAMIKTNPEFFLSQLVSQYFFLLSLSRISDISQYECNLTHFQ